MLTRILNIFASLLCVLMVAPAALAFFTNGFYVDVTSGSMIPTYQIGDVLLVTRNLPAHGLALRQIVVINPNAMAPQSHYTGDALHFGPFVHRIVAKESGGQYHTRGDANQWTDPGFITKANIEGLPMLRLTGVSALVFRCMNEWNVRIGAIISCALLFALAATLRKPRLRERNRASETAAEAAFSDERTQIIPKHWGL